MSRFRLLLLIVISVGATAAVARPANAQLFNYKEAVGYNALLAEKGAALEDGSGIRVVQPEALDGSGNYLPNMADSQFAGVSLSDGTGATEIGAFSRHATTVGKFFYGRTTSMTPGISSVTSYNVNDYFFRVMNFDAGGDPLPQGFDVGNHSYISGEIGPLTTNKLQRFDFVINRDNTVMVVGANNGRRLTPQFLAASYNAITVGRSDGVHSPGRLAIMGPDDLNRILLLRPNAPVFRRRLWPVLRHFSARLGAG